MVSLRYVNSMWVYVWDIKLLSLLLQVLLLSISSFNVAFIIFILFVLAGFVFLLSEFSLYLFVCVSIHL